MLFRRLPAALTSEEHRLAEERIQSLQRTEPAQVEAVYLGENNRDHRRSHYLGEVRVNLRHQAEQPHQSVPAEQELQDSVRLLLSQLGWQS